MAYKTVKMKSSQLGSQNGVNVEKFTKGRVYRILEGLADVFIAQDYAEEVEDTEMDDVPENKSAGEAPENKKSLFDKVKDAVSGDDSSDDDESDDGSGDTDDDSDAE